MPEGEDEFAVIARHFAPLADHPAARGLKDDAALWGQTVLTADAIVEGVHFRPGDTLDMVARKALRVNLSDLAAKGAAPIGYLLSLFWPNDRPADEIGLLAQGLAADQAEFGLALLGGDTVSTPGPLALSVTMLGRAGARTPARSGAQPGAALWVSGTIGDAGLGLGVLDGKIALPQAEAAWAADRYRLPRPRLDLAALVGAHAQASMDVSDGLLADAAKLAAASGVSIAIEAAAIPLSPAARGWLEGEADPEAGLARLAAFGDDYEILLAAAPAAAGALRAAGFARIGRVEAGSGVALIGANGPIPTAAAGYAHRLGR